MRSNLVDLTLIKVWETDKAIGFKETESDEELIWLSKAVIEVEKTKKEGIVVVTVPEYIAHEKGLI
jgi:hypothetical protein